MRLTDLAIKKLPRPDSGQRSYWDDRTPGFGVRISQGGARSFVVMYGERRRLKTIGRYPSLSLADARKEARRLLAVYASDPEPKRAMKYETAVGVFLDEWRHRTRPKTLRGYKIYLNRFGFQKNVAEITRGDIHRVLATLKDKPAAQNQAFTVMRLFFNWAIRNELVDKHPMRGERRPASVPSRDRTLTEQEVAAVLEAASRYPFGSIVKLLALTGQRRGEIGALRWEWIDEEQRLINLPPSITKNKKAHSFPYGILTRDVLASLPRITEFVFESDKGTAFSAWSKSKRHFDQQVDVPAWTLHDLRRTFSSTHAMLGTPIHVTEKLLNHVSGSVSGVAAIYNRHSYLQEMRGAVETYEAYIGNLVPL